MMNGSVKAEVVRKPEFGEVLRERAESLQSDYDRLRQTITRAQYDLNKLREYAEHLNELLKIEGFDPINLRDAASGPGFAKPGNRSENMPPRKPQYEGMSIADAIESVLTAHQVEVHADDLVRSIYDIKTKEELQIAKRSLVSTARTGVSKGRWKSIPGNRYRALQGQPALAEA